MIRIKPLTLTAALFAVAATQGAVAAKSASNAEVRGFKACVAAAEENGLHGISTRPTYFLHEKEDRTLYFVNVYAWENSERVSKRVRCETANKGKTLYSAELADGHYETDERSVLTVADSQQKSAAGSNSAGGR